jgi:3-methyladenine DNA glycosylase AlkD
MNSVIGSIRAELKASADEKTQVSMHRFFTEEVKTYGVKTSIVNKIAQRHWSEVKNLGKAEIFLICEKLLSSDFMEEAFIVSTWLPNMVDQFEPADLVTFRVWIERYVNNWAKCDSFCNHTVGEFVEKFPQSVNGIKAWAKSSNRWLKRAAAVSLILPARRGNFLKEVIEVSSTLLCEQDDMVQKGYGWLLKEASRLHQKEVFDFVIKNKQVMPRTALRYAIELMPTDLKIKAMKKD